MLVSVETYPGGKRGCLCEEQAGLSGAPPPEVCEAAGDRTAGALCQALVLSQGLTV